MSLKSRVDEWLIATSSVRFGSESPQSFREVHRSMGVPPMHSGTWARRPCYEGKTMITSLTVERLAESVLAVPPLCRNPDLTLNEAENAKLIRHIESGGIRTLLYGGNANFYHVALGEYDAVLSCLARLAGPDTLVI